MQTRTIYEKAARQKLKKKKEKKKEKKGKRKKENRTTISQHVAPFGSC